MENKIQTGLRIPEKRYSELVALADEIGISLNAIILMLVDLGLAVHDGKLILQEKRK